MLGGEHVVAHRGEGRVRIIRCPGRVRGFLEKTRDPAGRVGVDAPEGERLGARYADAGDGDVGARFDVRIDHLRRVHAVHVIGTEDHDVLGLFVGDEVHRLEDGVGAAGVPARSESLLGRHRVMYSPWKPDVHHVCEMCRSSECDLYCVSTQMRSYPALTRFDSTKSISR